MEELIPTSASRIFSSKGPSRKKDRFKVVFGINLKVIKKIRNHETAVSFHLAGDSKEINYDEYREYARMAE